MRTELITRKEIKNKYKKCATFGDFIDVLEKDHEKDGNVICGLKINGESIGSHDEIELALSNLDFIDEIEVSFEDSRVLVFETMQSLVGYVDQLKDEATKVANYFRTNCEQDGIKSFAEFVSACEWINDTFIEIRSAFSAQKMELRSSSLWHSTEQTFVSVLKAIAGAFEVKDYVLLADLLQYEIPEVLDHWREVLGMEIEHSKRKGLISSSSAD